MNIYLQVEVKVRELEGRLLLGSLAAERGHTTYIGDIWDFVRLAEAGLLQPGWIILKDITPEQKKIDWNNVFLKRGIKIANQDEEAGLQTKCYDEFARFRFGKDTLAQVAANFCWGPHDYESLRRLFPEFQDKIHETGSPRIDLCRPDSRSYYDSAQLQRVAGKKPCVLFVSNFAWVVGVNRLWGYIDQSRKAGYFKGWNDPSEFSYYDSFSREANLLKYFVRAFRRLANLHPDHTFVVRPHPVDSPEAWNILLGDIPNLVVSREYGIGNWLSHCRLLIHNGCTTAMEASVMKIPVISYTPCLGACDNDVSNSLGEVVEEEETLVDKVGQILDDCEDGKTEEGWQRMHHFFASLEDCLATEKILNIMEQGAGSAMNTSNRTMPIRLRYFYWDRLRPIARWAAIKCKVFHPPVFQNYHKFPPFHSAEILHGLQGVARLRKKLLPRYRLLGDRLVEISPK